MISPSITNLEKMVLGLSNLWFNRRSTTIHSSIIMVVVIVRIYGFLDVNTSSRTHLSILIL